MRDMTAAMRRERDALDTLEADEADATLVEEEWVEEEWGAHKELFMRRNEAARVKKKFVKKDPKNL